MKTYTVKLTEQQWGVIGSLLGDAPYKLAAPIVVSINNQLAAAIKAEQAAPIVEDETEALS